MLIYQLLELFHIFLYLRDRDVRHWMAWHGDVHLVASRFLRAASRTYEH